MDRIRCIAWDFDGVLNRNVVNGRFPWMDALPAKFGVSGEEFQSIVFRENFGPVMQGEIDILDLLAKWKNIVGFDGDVHEVMAFWFSEDAVPCPDMMSLMDRVHAAGLRQVIATNNEHRRSSYIENEMGFSDRIERLFSSGRMKVAKPDFGYFQHVQEELGLKPEEILFVDDYAENIEAATACGWQVHHFPEDGHNDLAERLSVIL
jgi:putative hydrolase of the HAD superfamily